MQYSSKKNWGVMSSLRQQKRALVLGKFTFRDTSKDIAQKPFYKILLV